MYYSKVRLDEMGNSMKRIVCPNCGASIYENEAKCPFCGYINMPGAEEKFMRDMHKTEEQLSQIPEIQKAEYKKRGFLGVLAIKVSISQLLQTLHLPLPVIITLRAGRLFFSITIISAPPSLYL